MRLTAIATGLAATAMLAAPPAHAGARVGVELVVGHDHGWGRETWRAGYDRGYHDGWKHGAKDGERDKDFDYWHDKRYDRADCGYRPYLGPLPVFQAGYREGYEQAYRRAYAQSHRRCTRDHHHGRYGDARKRWDDERRRRDWDEDDWR
jgi:hypothetical protein